MDFHEPLKGITPNHPFPSELLTLLYSRNMIVVDPADLSLTKTKANITLFLDFLCFYFIFPKSFIHVN